MSTQLRPESVAFLNEATRTSRPTSELRNEVEQERQ